METNYLLIVILIVVGMFLVYGIALGYSMFKLDSLQKVLGAYGTDKSSRPFFMRWTLLGLGFRRKQMQASIGKYSDQSMTKFIKYSGLSLLLVCAFTVLMIIGILFFGW